MCLLVFILLDNQDRKHIICEQYSLDCAIKINIL